MLEGRSDNMTESLISKDVEKAEKEEDENKSKPPPPWMRLVEEINYCIQTIRQRMVELTNAHQNHLLPKFGSEDSTEEEQAINILTDDITKLFQRGQSMLLKLKGDLNLNTADLTEEESMRRNIVSSNATTMQDLSVQFRKVQKDYLSKLKGRQQKGKTLFNFPDEVEDDTKFDVSFTPSQMEVVGNQELNIKQREQEILKIAKSIQDLAAMFKDMALLVIEAGTILDRIDHNIDQVKHNVDEGVKELHAAKKQQGSYQRKLCMLLLCLCIGLVIVIILIKGFVPSTPASSSS